MAILLLFSLLILAAFIVRACGSNPTHRFPQALAITPATAYVMSGAKACPALLNACQGGGCQGTGAAALACP